jgi:hypothetical protein
MSARRLELLVSARTLVLVALSALGGCGGAQTDFGLEFPRLDLSTTSLPEVSLARLGQALAWAQPIDVGGVVIRVPAPQDHLEACENESELRQALQRAMKSLRVLACYRPVDGGPIVTLSTLAHGRAVGSAEFVRYKQSLAARARLIQKAAATYTGSRALSRLEASPAEVLKVLSNGKNWVVHAVARAGARGPEQGVSVSVWLRERLLYLTQFDSGKRDWPALTDLGQTWATATIARTLWSRAH